MRRPHNWRRTLLVAALALALLVPWSVVADNVVNDVVAGGNDTMTAGESTTVSYKIVATGGDDQPGCNCSDGSAATVTINTPDEVTATPAELTFTECGVKQPVQFTSTTPGDFAITVSVSDSGPGSYHLTPAAFTLHVLEPSAPEDTTPPIITPHVTGTLGSNGWYVSDVTVSWTVEDPESPFTTEGCGPTTIDYDTVGVTLTCTATSAGGTASSSVTIKRDATLPAFGDCPPGGPFLLGSGTQAVGPISAEDATSGLDEGNSTLLGFVDTSTVGFKDVTFTAVDNAGNTAVKTCTYQVIYDFAGFFRPVDNPPVVNRVKAGSAIPVKFSLAGDQGLDIFAAGYPRSYAIASDWAAPIDDLPFTETVTAGGSSLSYDPVAGQYIYVWKTEKDWAGTWRMLVVRLNDGTDHVAYFTFTK